MAQNRDDSDLDQSIDTKDKEKYIHSRNIEMFIESN